MARRSIEERNIRSLQKTGGGKSYIITLPIEMIHDLEWQAKQKLTVKRHGEGILITDYKKKKK